MAREGAITNQCVRSSNRLWRRTNYIGARVPNIVLRKWYLLKCECEFIPQFHFGLLLRNII